MTTEPSVRTAVIGYGLAGAYFHAPFIAATPGMSVTAVVTAAKPRQDQARAEHPDAAVIASVDQLWRDLPERPIDLVVVATPNVVHVPLALEALRHGCHVVVDKPFAATSAACREVVAAAATAGRVLSVFQNRRFDGDFLTVQHLVGSGALGLVHRFESRFERWRPRANLGAWREAAEVDTAGGLLYDLGSHLIDQAAVLFGPVAAVYCECDRRRLGVTVDDDTFIALTHASGVRSHLWASSLAGQEGPRFRVLGSTAAYTSWGLDPQEDALRAGARPGGADWGRVPEERWGRLGTAAPLPVETLPGDYGRFYREMRAAIVGSTPPPVDPGQATRVIELIEAAQRSAADRRVVRVDG